MALTARDLPQALKGRHLTRVEDFGADELRDVLDLADELKELQRGREPHELLPGPTLAMIFQKPSTRTRVSFEVRIAQLGGRGLFTSPSATSSSRAARRSRTRRTRSRATSTRS